MPLVGGGVGFWLMDALPWWGGARGPVIRDPGPTCLGGEAVAGGRWCEVGSGLFLGDHHDGTVRCMVLGWTGDVATWCTKLYSTRMSEMGGRWE
jgi:hypothetical protein